MSPLEALKDPSTPSVKKLIALARVLWADRKWRNDLLKALSTLFVAICGSAAIMLFSTKAHAFTANQVEAQHCGVEGGCILISKQRLQQEITRYAEEAYENGLKRGMNACRENI